MSSHIVKKVACVCDYCKETFYKSEKYLKRCPAKYCSRYCQKKAHAPIERICLQCGEKFYVTPTQLKFNACNYCSRKCVGESQKTGTDCNCAFCGKQLYRSKSTTKDSGNYCDTSCALKARWIDPDKREILVEAHDKACKSDAFRQKQREISIAVRKRPGMREKYHAAHNTPEAKEKRKLSWNKYYENNPGKKEERNQRLRVIGNRPDQKIVQNLPETNAKRSASLKKTLSNPIIRALRSERVKLDWKNQELTTRRVQAMKDAMADPEYIKSVSGPNNKRWNGGKSFEPYGLDFNKEIKEYIRNKFNRKCYLCDKLESDGKRKLDVHHINYNKRDNQEKNLIALCKRCHTKTNNNRWYWFNLLVCNWIGKVDILI